MARVTLNHLTKHYGDVPVVRDITLTIEDGEFFSLLGPSGCGKTTILRMIAGFTFPTGGVIRFDEKDVSFIPPEKRNTGMVFQNYALFPHMTVFENVSFGLRTRRVAPSEMADRVAEALKKVGLAGLENRPTPNLSGGQQQRVALARAVVIEPDLLLLDEPLSNLDARLREETRDQIRMLQKQLKITTIYVTHDQEEALAASDRIAVLRDGVCEQMDVPDRIYRNPVNRFVASFMGKMNLWKGATSVTENGVVFRHENGGVMPLAGHHEPVEGIVYLGAHPQSVVLSPDETDGAMRGLIRDRRFKGAAVEFLIEADGLTLIAVVPSDEPVASKRAGEVVWASIPGDRLVLLRD